MRESTLQHGSEDDRERFEAVAAALGEPWVVKAYVPIIATGSTIQLAYRSEKPLSNASINGLMNMVTGASRMWKYLNKK